jgi:hypothetical protein
VAQQQRGPIGRAAHHLFGAEVATGARLVFHHHGLRAQLAQALGHLAREHVVATAGRKGHDDTNRPVAGYTSGT